MTHIQAGGRPFSAHSSEPESLVSTGGNWRITEAALVIEDGETLPRLPWHIAYWFAWHNFRPGAKTRFE